MPEQDHDLVAGLEADLAAIAAADADVERDAEVAERTRIERSTLTLADRLRGQRGPVDVVVRGGARHAGRVQEVGDGWVVLAPPAGRPGPEHLVVLGSTVVVRGLGRTVGLVAGPVGARSLSSVLRAWCRDRSEVSVHTVDGTLVRGLASAAYADHLDLSTGEGTVVTVPFGALAVLSR